MIIGIPKELKNNEFRVAATPSGVHAYVVAGHTVLVEKNAGTGSAISDADYIAAGASIIDSADEIWQKADLIQKVKEPIEIEYKRMRKGQILFTYLHLAANKLCTQAIIDSGITAIAYETVEVDGQLPLLAPMSEVAGRMSIQVGAAALEASKGGRGVLLGGVPGVRPGKVVVIGAGVVGVAAATIAHGMRADVTVMDLDLKRLAQIDQIFAGNVKTLASSAYEIEKEVTQADLVIGAVLVHGAKAPKLVSNDLVKKMKPGSVLVDVAIDQGGCFTDSKATTHQEPTFKVHNSIFYCVANMPGAVPATSTYALANATIKYGLALANKGWEKALADDEHLAKGLNAHEGKIMYAAVAKAHNL
ncbi:alanine dehydrogenase [Candidatus Nanopelagicus abundans]|uniref:Alanine dehydrogenase n=1 Tax=Candidatus Nanopelagicus abundans TaxID=1884916 RepID=A0A249L456_9ACTN|nr:alanine dehydrogenase [Candidatus Nanopelagicus abundans]ASY23725.1 alanine dehydrogenase [Candidatus Nanopelagicus abundans]